MGRKNIRNFDCIRGVIEKMYTYGFYTREEFIQKGIVGSPRAYDDIVRQLRDLYCMEIDDDATALKEDTEGRGRYKCYKFNRDYFESAGEQLSAAYGLFAISDSAIADTIRCMSLAASPNGTSVSDVARISVDEEGTDHTPTISRRMSDLRNAGYIKTEKRENHLNNILKGLSDERLIGLYYLSSFFAGAGYPRVAAVFLRDALRRHIAFKQLPQPTEAFLFRDNACGNVFDEPIVYELLLSCKNHTEVEVTLHKVRRTLKPVYLKIDTKLGRWYLFAVCDDKPMVSRVSNISKVMTLPNVFDYEQALSLIEESFQKNYISSNTVSMPVHIEAELCFDNPAMRVQFEREMLIGSIECRDEADFYCADVNDPTEVKPFLRSYGAYLKILPSESHSLDLGLRQEYERMLNNYGTV